MHRNRSSVLTLLFVLALVTLAVSCGGDQSSLGTPPELTGQQIAAPQDPAPAAAGWPAGLPVDGVQPWETLGPEGYVVAAGRDSSSITLDAEYVEGVDIFTQGGSAANVDGVLNISSGSAGSGDTSYAIYRFVLGGQDPGALGVDINLRNRSDSSPSEYYLGLADYGTGSWDWHGPYTDGQVRLGMSGDMLSGLGNAFVAVVAFDGADIDVVGLGINQANGGDTTAPPVPTAPSVTAIDGGLLLEWIPVVAGDLAGYNVYYSSSPFVDHSSVGVKDVGYIEGNTRHVLSGLTAKTYVSIAAVDISGNESAFSGLASGTPLAGSPGSVEFTVDKAIGLIGDSFTVTASGAGSYDFDLDGDGTFELTGESSGTQVYNANASGIIRPAVRGTSGTSVALGAVSLVVSGNSRPVARLYADPSEGIAPFSVNFTSEGEDYGGSIAEYAWDFEGDGVYDQTSPSPALSPKVYANPGVFNAKLRVTDDSGATDVDTVAIFARQFIGFNNYYIDQDVDPENNISSALVDGNPAVVYLDFKAPNLQYRRALDAEGRTWGNPVDITAPGVIGDFPGIAVIKGRPAITWWDPATNEIKYLIADDAQGSSWSLTPVVVGPNPTNTPWRITIAEVANNPAIAWTFSSNLQYRRASSAAGTGATPADWGDPVAVIDNTGFVGGPADLAVVDGNPAVVYFNGNTGHLNFKRAVTPTGALVGDWPAGPVDCTPAGFAPIPYCNLLVVNGNPAISFPDGTVQAMYFMRALDSAGAAWPAGAVKVSASSSTPNYNDMQIVRGRPAIVFEGFYPFQSVWYTRAADANGSTWAASMPVLLNTWSSPGDFVSLVSNNGQPNVIYKANTPPGIGIGIPALE